MQKKKVTAETLAALERLWARHCRWGELEQLAGVTDRQQFWTGRTEESARAELRTRILARLLAGELPT